MSYQLVDVEERNREHPDTFEIPEGAVRRSLKPGEFAKVIFNDEERMWLQVEGIDEQGRYVGVLKNQPICIAGLSYGDRVTFEAKHICDFMDRRDDHRPVEEHVSRAKEHLGHAIMFLDSGHFDTARTAILRSLGNLKQISNSDTQTEEN